MDSINHQDPHAIALLNHIYAHAEEIWVLGIDPSVKEIPIAGLPASGPSNLEKEREKFRKELNDLTFNYYDVASSWTTEEEIGIRDSISGIPYRTDPRGVRWAAHIRKEIDALETKAKDARTDKAGRKKDLTGPGVIPKGLPEQKLTKIISSILETIIKEENGEKELCN